LRLFQAFKEGGDISQLQVDQVEQQLLQGRSSLLTDEQQYGDSLDRLRLQLGLPLDLPLELDDAALRDVTRQFRRYEQVLRQCEEASQQAARLGSAANLRAELRRLAAEAPLVQKTRFQREFSEHRAGWERITTAELKMRISRIRADLRRLLDQLTEKERSGKT